MKSAPSPHVLRWLAAAAVALVPVLSHPAAAQQRDRSMNGIFRNDAPETSAIIHAPPAAVWRALSEVYAEMGFPMATASNPGSMEYLTNFMELRGRLLERPNGEWFDCQWSDPLNDLTNTGQISFAVRSRVAPGEGGASVLHTQVDARARRRGTSASRVDCTTTAKLEQALGRLVDQRVQQLAHPAPAAAPARPQPE
ncbi:MAG TPA: hypothetical protein VFJ16_28235 [Longimicrobium sp.]|nr:hypothetical protein [Longimicrobium sp.]